MRGEHTMPSVFTNKHLVEYLASKNKDMKKSQIRKMLNDTVDGIRIGLKKNDKVRITGLGVYTKKKIPAKKGGQKIFMPALGREVTTKPKPAQTKIKFRAAKDLKKL